jgi:hypothetical protein
MNYRLRFGTGGETGFAVVLITHLHENYLAAEPSDSRIRRPTEGSHFDLLNPLSKNTQDIE